MFFTFNDLSARKNNICTEDEARQEFQKLASFCHGLSSLSVVEEMMLPDTFFSISLFNNYNISDWLSDTNVPITKRQFMRRFLDKHRRFYGEKDIEGEFCIAIDGQDHKSVGCAFALERDHTLLSLSTNEVWKNITICGKYTSLDEFGELLTTDHSIENVWTDMTSVQLTAIQRERLFFNISSGQDLWENREKLYPNLVFCECVKTQLMEDSEKYHITAVMKKLERFQEYFSNCGEKYDPFELGLGARTESETVKSNPKLKKLRCFKLPNGEEKYFFDHVGFSGKYSGGRIHFLPDNKNQKCYIGYIGKHLDTKNV